MPLSPQGDIRPARPDDWPELAALWRRSVEATHHFLQPSDLERIAAAMPRVYLPAMRELWLLEREGCPLGFRGGDALRVEMLFVDPPFFGQGVGRALLRHACAGKRRVELDVNEQNAGARAFYARLGFRVCGRSPVDNDGRPYPLLHLVWEADGGRAQPFRSEARKGVLVNLPPKPPSLPQRVFSGEDSGAEAASPPKASGACTACLFYERICL